MESAKQDRCWHGMALLSIASFLCVALQNVQLSSLDGKRPLQWIAEQTEKYSGADLHELATEAARHSVRSTTSLLSGLRYQIVQFLLHAWFSAV